MKPSLLVLPLILTATLGCGGGGFGKQHQPRRSVGNQRNIVRERWRCRDRAHRNEPVSVRSGRERIRCQPLVIQRGWRNYSLGGFCGETNTDALSLTITGSSVTFALSETLGSEVLGAFNLTGTLSADGNAVTGTFTPTNAATSDCPVTGTFTAKRTKPLAGTFSGMLALIKQSSVQNYTITVTLSESATSQLSTTGSANAVPFTWTGTVAANGFSATGSLDGFPVNVEAVYIPGTALSQLVVFDLQHKRDCGHTDRPGVWIGMPATRNIKTVHPMPFGLRRESSPA